MIKRNKMPKLNINVIKNSSQTIHLTPRNNEKNSTLFSESNDFIVKKYIILPSRNHYPLSSVQRKSNNFLLNKTYHINKKTQSTEYDISNNILLFSSKNLDTDDCLFTERLKTSSTRFSRLELNKEKFNKLTKRLDKAKKKKLNVNSIESLLKAKKYRVNEVNFIPSPNLMNISLLSKNKFLNNLQNNQNQKMKEDKKSNNNKDNHLPIFLRDKYNIKGTNIISPFCIKARDKSLYKRIFYNYFTKSIIMKKKGVENKLNIVYAENEEKLKKKIKNINEKRRKQGKREKNAVFPNSVEYKLAKINHKIKFMKKIVDYAYPEMVLTRVREANKILDNSGNIKNLPPFKSVDYHLEQYNKNVTKELSKSLNIQKI